MIEYRKGNLVEAFLNGEVRVLAHQANCFCNFGSGIAREIKEKIPAAYEVDRATASGSKKKLGWLSSAVIDNRKGQRAKVCNLYGQYDYGKRGVNTDYKALTSALEFMRSAVMVAEAMTGEELAVGMPKIGCGLGGGDWSIVKTIIEGVFHDRTIYVYEL